MPIFSYSDVINDEFRNQDLESLFISDRSSLQLIIARMLIGSIKITHLYRNYEFYQLNDCLSNFYTSDSLFPNNKMSSYISEDLDESDLSTFFADAASRRNSKFYARLLNEFSHYFYHTERENYTSAFIYIYRILEVISYAFPLIYATQTDDFKNTYGYLKDYFSENKGNNKGELGFFKSFVVKTFGSNPIYSTSVDFDFSIIRHQQSKEILFKKIRQICKGNILHPDTTDFDKLSVNFTDMGSFIIIIRNRFFHLANRGDSNLESEEIFDSDAFFEILNHKCIGWISLIYFEILKNSLSNIR